jgi:ribonuclease HI
LSRPSREQLIAVIAEVEGLDRTLAQFPGLSREDLVAVLLGKKKHEQLELPQTARPSPGGDRKPGRVLHAWTDGASRGNPGAAAIGVVIMSPDGKLVAEVAEAIGRKTNNVAEYAAVIAALERASELGADKLMLHADSELVVKQLNGVYRVKHQDMIPLHRRVKELESRFSGGVSYKHVRREQNAEADRLANEALDRE